MDAVDLNSEDTSKFSYSQELAINGTVQSYSNSVNERVMQNTQNIVQQQSDPCSCSIYTDRVASMKVFTSVMLHAWRQRRADVRKLQQLVERLQRNSIHSKNELHVSNTLIRVEQKRCLELQLELKKSTLSISKVRSSCEKLTTSVRSLQADNDKLEYALRSSRQEYVALERKAIKYKDKLTHALIAQRNLQLQLDVEQSNVHKLMCDKENLLKKIRSIESDQRRREDSHGLELEQKNRELNNMRSTLETLERKVRDQQIKRNDLKQCLKNLESRQLKDFEPHKEKEPPQLIAHSSHIRLRSAPKAEEYGLHQILSTVKYYTSSAAFLLWLLLLPNKSVRYGCMPNRCSKIMGKLLGNAAYMEVF